MSAKSLGNNAGKGLGSGLGFTSIKAKSVTSLYIPKVLTSHERAELKRSRVSLRSNNESVQNNLEKKPEILATKTYSPLSPFFKPADGFISKKIKNMTFKQESILLLLLSSIPYLFFAIFLPLSTLPIYPNEVWSIVIQVCFSFFALAGFFAWRRLNQRHAMMVTMNKVINGEGTLRCLYSQHLELSSFLNWSSNSKSST
jgi:hypothetical protein